MNRQLPDGDQVGILVEATDPAGYYTHLHRIACIGRIPAELAEAFEVERQLQDLNLTMLKPGAHPVDLLEATNDFLRNRGR